VRIIGSSSPQYGAFARWIRGRARVAYDVPVRCGDVLVYPQDLIFAIHDGIVVIPQAIDAGRYSNWHSEGWQRRSCAI